MEQEDLLETKYKREERSIYIGTVMMNTRALVTLQQ